MNFHVNRAARCVASLSIVTILAACAGTASMPARTADGALTDQAGMTLYTFDRDAAGSGKSACAGPCAANWPAFTAAGAAAPAAASGDWTLVARDDGSKQWAYKGRPLYTFVKDAKPGDRTGDGFLNGAWHVARP